MSSRSRAILICFLYFLLLPTAAFACSPVPQSVRVLCTLRPIASVQPICFGTDCSTQFKTDEIGTHVVSSHLNNSIYISNRYGILFSPLQTQHRDDALTLIQSLCIEDMQQIRSDLLHAIDSWARDNQNLPYTGNGDLVLEPYTPEKEQSLSQAKVHYTTCRYQEFVRLDSWLLSSDAIREYCTMGYRFGAPCPLLNLSLLSFFLFLVGHIQFSTLPYLGVFLLFIVLFASAVRYGYRHERWRVFRPDLWIIVGAIVISGFSITISGLLNVPLVFVISYCALCVIRALRRAISTKI